MGIGTESRKVRRGQPGEQLGSEKRHGKEEEQHVLRVQCGEPFDVFVQHKGSLCVCSPRTRQVSEEGRSQIQKGQAL